MKETNILTKRAEARGWGVRNTRNGHIALKAPCGTTIVTSSTPSDRRGQRNNRAMMRAAGFDDIEGTDQEREERMARASSAGISNSAVVLAVLQGARTGVAMTPIEIADKTNPELDNVQVSAALQWLKAKHPEVQQQGRGLWLWVPPPRSARAARYAERHAEIDVVAAQPDLAEPSTPVLADLEVKPESNGHVPRDVDEVYALTTATTEIAEAAATPVTVQVAERQPIQVVPSSLPKGLPAMFEAVSTDAKGRLVLRDENGDHWLAVALKPVL